MTKFFFWHRTYFLPFYLDIQDYTYSSGLQYFILWMRLLLPILNFRTGVLERKRHDWIHCVSQVKQSNKGRTRSREPALFHVWKWNGGEKGGVFISYCCNSSAKPATPHWYEHNIFFFLYTVNNLAGVIASTQCKLGPGSPQMSSKFLREFSAFWYFGHGTPGHYNKLST